MNKKLPSVFANKIEKVNNNEKMYYSKDVKKEEPKINKPTLNINQKINSIFSSPKYVYKADVDILLKTGKTTKKIIGKNTNNLITIENELIPISDILDIDFTKK